MTNERRVPVDNLDPATVQGFGEEWTAFDQSALTPAELQAIFSETFQVFPWDALPPNAAGADVGCGSGRWARFFAARVGKLYCIDASEAALRVAASNLRDASNCYFVRASASGLPLAENSLDFAYSVGVLHHIPDTAAGIRECVSKIKPGAPFFVYLYYAFDDRSELFRFVWKVSDGVRRVICRMPFRLRLATAQIIAALVYWPLARFARLCELGGMDVRAFLLTNYRNRSFYVMRNDSLDRFGTRLERRFTCLQIKSMMTEAGLKDIVFADNAPFWTAVGYKGYPVTAPRCVE